MKTKKILFGISGSFCNIAHILQPLKVLCEEYEVHCVISDNVKKLDTRFFKANELVEILEKLTKHPIIDNLVDAEKVGPFNQYDLMVIAPMTSTVCSKLYHGIYDHPITLAAKAMLRNNKNILFGISCNDGLGISGKNIFSLLNNRNMYVIPFSQDQPFVKAHSIVSHWDELVKCVKLALNNQQLQPILRQKMIEEHVKV